MKELNPTQLHEIADELTLLRAEMLELESSLVGGALEMHESHRHSAQNLAHYLALRRHDIRDLQAQLASLGLSSLGRTEGHVMDAVHAVLRVLTRLSGNEIGFSPSEAPLVEIGEGAKLLEKNTNALLGPCPHGRKVRIMVTMSSEAASDYALVRDFLAGGMDCMRINCAHDTPEIWASMISNLQKAREETGRHCRVLMDVAGPKLRTGPIEPGPAVIKCRPKRNEMGKVLAPARTWLTPAEKMHAPSSPMDACLPIPATFLTRLRCGDVITFRDTRGACPNLQAIT